MLAPGVDTQLFRPRDRGIARRRLGLASEGRYGLFVGWARELGRLVPAYEPFRAPREVSAVFRALGLVAAGEAVPAVAEARAVVLEHHTIAAFEGRWRDLLLEMGLLPACQPA